ncbi:MAG: hypothetical protein ABI763_11605 [Bacteroidota bacterium]
MLIYNKQWIDNLEIQEQSANWLKKSFISKEEFDAIALKYESLYHASNMFVRAGMFLFTLLIIVSSVGLFNLFALASNQMAIALQSLFFGGVYYFVTANFVKQRHYFRSGITDALLYASVISASTGVVFAFSGNNFAFNLDPVIYIAAVLPIFIFASIRFRDAFLALLSFIGLFTINVLLVLKAGTIGKLILPFEGMIFSFIIYWISKSWKKREGWHYWKKCFSIVEAASLVTLYLSGNYLVVRELSNMLAGSFIVPGEDIPFAYFFYAFTIAAPLLYVWLGMKQKNYMLIRAGILLVAAGIMSIRYYYSILAPEIALTVAGIFLIAVAWLGISYLKIPRNGITSVEDDDSRNEAFEAIGSVLVSRAAGGTIHSKEDNPFGGGSSGGGGAGSAY